MVCKIAIKMLSFTASLPTFQIFSWITPVLVKCLVHQMWERPVRRLWFHWSWIIHTVIISLTYGMYGCLFIRGLTPFKWNGGGARARARANVHVHSFKETRQSKQLCPKTTFFLRKNELPQAGFEPMTFCMLYQVSHWGSSAGQAESLKYM